MTQLEELMSVTVKRQCRVELALLTNEIQPQPVLLHLEEPNGSHSDVWYLSAEVARRIRDQLSEALQELAAAE